MDKKMIARELLEVAKMLASNKEYVIWGIPRGETEETLLLTSVQGKKIEDRGTAQRLMKLLEEKYGATKTRIQEIDMEGEFDWMKAIKGATDNKKWLVKWDFNKYQPQSWASKTHTFGKQNEGFEIEAPDLNAAKELLKSKHNLNPFYLTVEPK